MGSTSVAQGGTFRLTLNIRTQSGSYVDADANPTFSITDPTATPYPGFQNIASNHAGLGQYFYDFQVPSAAIIGNWSASWNAVVQTSPFSYVEPFAVTPPIVVSNQAGTYPPGVMELINRVRIQLSDNHPDRKYHFQPPNPFEAIQGFTEIKGQNWTDQELYAHIQSSIATINANPPATSLTVDAVAGGLSVVAMPGVVAQPGQPLALGVTVLGAAIYAMIDRGLLWLSEEFSYNLDGVSLDLSKSDKYLGAAGSLMAIWKEQITQYKLTINIFRGLAQPRITVGAGSRGFLGPRSGKGMDYRYPFSRGRGS